MGPMGAAWAPRIKAKRPQSSLLGVGGFMLRAKMVDRDGKSDGVNSEG